MKLIFLLLGFLEFLTQILIFYSLDLSKPKSLTLDISTMYSVRRSNDLVELSKVPSGCNDIWIRTFEFVAKTHCLYKEILPHFPGLAT